MAGIKLEDLPIEIIQHVGTFVRATDRPSLYSLGLTNHHLHTALVPVIFERVCLRVRSKHRLHIDVPKWLEVLSRNAAMRHVRRLDIVGFIPTLDCETCFPYGNRPLAVDPDSADDVFGSSDLPKDDEDEAIYVSEEMDQGWAPAAELIATLPHLLSLVYDCNTNFSPCLLKAVHANHPKCKLNIKSFRFRSLEEENVAPHELALVASPCLHAITVGYTHNDVDLGGDNQEAALLIVAGLAMNVKHLRVVRKLGEDWGEDSEDEAEEPPQGLRMNRWVPQTRCKGLLSPMLYSYRYRGFLQSLSITGDLIQTYHPMRAWARHTDFTVLQHLGLECGVTIKALQWANKNCSFPRLKELILSVADDIECYSSTSPALVGAAIEFLCKMPPLETLCLSGTPTRGMLNPTLKAHGPSLRTFHFRSGNAMSSGMTGYSHLLLDRDDVAYIRRMCPLLEELQLPIRRTKSDAREISIYRELAGMRKLRVLDIMLDCSALFVLRQDDRTPSEPSFDEYENEFYGQSYETHHRPRRGHIRNALQNGAIDESLARSIWQFLCNHGSGNQLQSLKIGKLGEAEFGRIAVVWAYTDRPWVAARIDDIFPYNMGRSYVLRRCSSGVGDMVLASEVNSEQREMAEERYREIYGDFFLDREDAPREGSTLEIFQRIWPRKEGSRGWRDDWESIPVRGVR